MEIEMEQGHVSPNDIWESRDEWMAEHKARTEAWEALPSDEQDVIIRMVQGCMERMSTRVDEWLPETWVGGLPGSGDYLTIKMLFTDIDRQLDD